MALRILLVDDEADVRESMRLLLEAHGHVVEVAADGRAGVAAAARNQPDLVFMDLVMPGMDGLAATRELRANAKTRDIAIIALSAYVNQARWIGEAMEAGVTDVLVKPIGRHDLQQALSRFGPG